MRRGVGSAATRMWKTTAGCAFFRPGTCQFKTIPFIERWKVTMAATSATRNPTTSLSWIHVSSASGPSVNGIHNERHRQWEQENLCKSQLYHIISMWVFSTKVWKYTRYLGDEERHGYARHRAEALNPRDFECHFSADISRNIWLALKTQYATWRFLYITVYLMVWRKIPRSAYSRLGWMWVFQLWWNRSSSCTIKVQIWLLIAWLNIG